MKRGGSMLVTKANAIVEASYRLTLQEQRLVLFCVAQVDSRQSLEQQRTFVVEAAPFRETFGLSAEKVYEELKDAAVRLFERKVTLSDAQTGQETLLRWVSMIRYQNRRGRVVLNFSPEMLPFISALKDRFTSYPLESVARLSSTFAIRMFEVLAQYAGLGRRQVTVEQLRRWLDCVDSYPRFSEFERWVVAPAVAQLNERFEDGDTVNMETLKTARLVKGTYVTVKVLGNGDLAKKLTVEGCKVSTTAKEKIEKAGGSVVEANKEA